MLPRLVWTIPVVLLHYGSLGTAQQRARALRRTGPGSWPCAHSALPIISAVGASWAVLSEELRHIRSKEGVKKTSWPCPELLELAP
eukprot:scaffold9923_cov38-Phaeocystis_antarctica.AAC.2